MKTNTNQAMVNADSLPISPKTSTQMCDFIRGKELNKAKMFIQQILEMKIALPMKRFNADRGHKKGGVGPGRYPLKICETFLGLLDSVKSNAENKGLNGEKLVIKAAIANRGARRWRSGRKGRVQMKNTHIHILVEEKKAE